VIDIELIVVLIIALASVMLYISFKNTNSKIKNIRAQNIEEFRKHSSNFVTGFSSGLAVIVLVKIIDLITGADWYFDSSTIYSIIGSTFAILVSMTFLSVFLLWAFVKTFFYSLNTKG